MIIKEKFICSIVYVLFVFFVLIQSKYFAWTFN